MKRILINSIKKEVQEYVTFMKPLSEHGLLSLKSGIIKYNSSIDSYVSASIKYIDELIKNITLYLSAEPNKWNTIVPSVSGVKLEDLYNYSLKYKETEKIDKSGTVTKTIESGVFYKLLVQYMQYEKTRRYLGPIHNKLSIYACVYCNAAPIVSSRSGNDVFYELDHYMPKSTHPYLCVNFYNLQPSCAACNKRKLANTTKQAFDLYTDDESKLMSPFRFVPLLTKYDGTDKDFEIKFMGDNKTITPLSEDNNNLFHIENRYQAYNSIVNRLYKEINNYPDCVIQAWKQALDITVTKREIEECIFRFPMDESKIHSEMLLKLKQDTIKQMEEIGIMDKYI